MAWHMDRGGEVITWMPSDMLLCLHNRILLQ
jgi:hypothetical protein